MTDSKDNFPMTRQTVDLQVDLMEYFDAIKRRRGFRSFSAYVVTLIQRDRDGITQTGTAGNLIVKSGKGTTSTSEQSGTMPSDRQINERIMLALDRMADGIDDLGERMDRIERKTGSHRAARAAKAKAS